MKEIVVEFKRTSPIVEKGRCSMKVEDPTDVEEIQEKMAQGKFVAFVITDREYLDVEWDWHTVDTNRNENDDETA